jgi:hypothetical protein
MTTPFPKIIPHGKCECGCGQATTIARQSITSRGIVRGQPIRFVRNHHRIKPRALHELLWVEGQPCVRIPLTQGLFALIDESDYEEVNKVRWFAIRRKADSTHLFYARTNFSDGSFKGLHQFLMKPPTGLVVDHINGDGLDNRRCNLRVCTRRENGRNRSANGNKKGFKGVSFDKVKDAWIASLYLGSFATREEAADTYDAASLLVFPEFTRLNSKERK